jgi:hypothetical protein
MYMQTLLTETNGIHDDHEYHDISERLRQVDRAIIQLIVIKEEYEKMIEEYLQDRNQKPV